jgi:hypothetical protein
VWQQNGLDRRATGGVALGRIDVSERVGANETIEGEPSLPPQLDEPGDKYSRDRIPF